MGGLAELGRDTVLLENLATGVCVSRKTILGAKLRGSKRLDVKGVAPR
jgi:hypothetical protein